MSLAQYSTVCTHKECIASNIFVLRFTKPAQFTFTPGQFVLWQVPLLTDSTDVQPRAYSIASVPTDHELEFVFKYEPGGRASEWVQRLIVGDSLQFQGPLGVMKLQAEPTSSLLVCTSTGIAPLISMAESALYAHDSRSMYFVFGVRSQEDIFWEDRLQKLQNQFSNFRYTITLSMPSANWNGAIGRVQRIVKTVADLQQYSVYACGNPTMTKEIKQYCLEQGLAKKQVHIEGFI